jgi:hypothetical protein
MSRTLELPDEVFADVEKAAAVKGTTPVGFIAEAAAVAAHTSPDNPNRQKKTLRERSAGLIGGFHSGSTEPLSEETGENFTDYLEQKRREGRL